MTLNAYVAEKKRKIFEELKHGGAPSEGSYSEETLKEARVKGEPQIGTARFEPHAITLEFIYPDPLSTSAIVSVTLEPPERVVFMPVPDWVVESVWQGEVSGSYHFESDARKLLSQFEAILGAEENLLWFGRRQPVGRQ